MKNRLMSYYVCVGVGLNQFFPEWIKMYILTRPRAINIISTKGNVSSRKWNNAHSFVKNKGKQSRRTKSKRNKEIF